MNDKSDIAATEHILNPKIDEGTWVAGSEPVPLGYHNPRSTARLAGHPIHPMLISFPIAFFVATFACDVGFALTGGLGWLEPTMWLLGAGLALAGLAAVAGVTDFLGERKIRALPEVWWHAGGNLLVIAIEVANVLLRNAMGQAVVLPTGIVLSGVSVGILLLTGWMGWQMVYRHRVGVADCLP